jgi:tetratricopeptide (TPR) repeat protein
MPEGIIGGILGEADDKPGLETPEALAGAEAFASAVVARLSASDPEVARKTVEFLGKQSTLLETQNRRLEDEHALRLTHLRYQSDLLRRQRLGQTLRIGFQLFLVLVATVIGLVAAVMIRDAVTSRRVVIEPFDAPPALAPRGLTGKVIAVGLLDEFSRLQDATHVTSEERDIAGAWADDIRIDVPETGISLGEISRLLRERFGHDVHIDGNLIETPTGELALTVRGQGVPPKTFAGRVTELDKITVAAADYVYSKAQPRRWAGYLNASNRYAETIEFARTNIASASPENRPGLLVSWAWAIGASGGSTRECLGLLRAAVKLKPDAWNAWNNLLDTFIMLGDEEGAWKAGEEMRNIAGGRPGRAPESAYANWDPLTWNLQAWLASTLADAEAHAGWGSAPGAAGVSIADIQVRLHDSDAADLALKTMQDDPNDPITSAMTHYDRGRLAAETGDTAMAATELEAFGEAYANPLVFSQSPGYNCWIAPAEESAGHPDKADALLKSAGTYVDCYRFRGDIFDSRGEWAAAQKSYANAVALAPDLPASYYSWGVALAHHRDLDAAAAKLKDANQRGPHWADPLKAWGDVLAQQGKIKDALAKYDQALKYAPNWKQLKKAREAAAKQKS